MRILEERKDYKIIYHEDPYQDYIDFNYLFISAYIEDSITKNRIFDQEPLKSTLEKCLVKLGKRLIKKWNKEKK